MGLCFGCLRYFEKNFCIFLCGNKPWLMLFTVVLLVVLCTITFGKRSYVSTALHVVPPDPFDYIGNNIEYEAL